MATHQTRTEIATARIAHRLADLNITIDRLAVETGIEESELRTQLRNPDRITLGTFLAVLDALDLQPSDVGLAA